MIQVTLQDVEEMVSRLIKEQQDLDSLMERAALIKGRVDQMETELIPNVLREVGITEMKLADGSKLTVEPVISTSISEGNWPAAEQWLVSRDLDGIIKNLVTLAFDKGENDASVRFAKLLDVLVKNNTLFEAFLAIADQVSTSGFLEDPKVAEVGSKKAIHPQTLKAFVREQMRQGVDVPEQIFGLFITDKVKIKSPS